MSDNAIESLARNIDRRAYNYICEWWCDRDDEPVDTDGGKVAFRKYRSKIAALEKEDRKLLKALLKARREEYAHQAIHEFMVDDRRIAKMAKKALKVVLDKISLLKYGFASVAVLVVSSLFLGKKNDGVKS